MHVYILSLSERVCAEKGGNYIVIVTIVKQGRNGIPYKKEKKKGNGSNAKATSLCIFMYSLSLITFYLPFY